MARPVTYATEDEAIAVLKRTGYSRSADSGWQSAHNEQRAEIKSDDARSYFWIEFKSTSYKFTANS